MVDLGSSDSKTLVALMEIALKSADALDERELAVAYTDLMHCPVGLDQSDMSGREGESHVTIGELLRSPKPPLGAIKRIKAYAQECRSKEEAEIPPAVATALYYYCIAVASLTHGILITSLNKEQMCDGYGWCLQQLWIDSDLRDSVSRAQDQLEL